MSNGLTHVHTLAPLHRAKQVSFVMVIPCFRTTSNGSQQSSIDSENHRHGPIACLFVTSDASTNKSKKQISQPTN
jgi:hypothetical protein